MPKKACFLLLALFLFVFWGAGSPVLAVSQTEPLFKVAPESVSLHPGESVSVAVKPQHRTLSAFVLTAEFGEEITAASAAFTNIPKEDHHLITEEEGRITIVYASDAGIMSEDAEIILTFRTNPETAAADTSVLLSVTDAADADANLLLDAPETHRVDLTFVPDTSADCRLMSLTPPVGALIPAFDPDIYEYTLDVPFSYQSLEWDAIPADDATVRVNRKNLGAGGTTVDFIFTVTAADGKTKAVYTVHVTRLPKEEDPEASAPSTDCTLLVLTPPVGELKPAFDPNIYEYTLEVPFAYQSLEWDVIPADDATVRVNRKNLGAGGSTTDFKFTVTDADGKTKSIYTVHVTRLKKEESTDTELPSADCTLVALTPPVGELKPAFDPNIYEYTLEVPFTYQSLEWDAIPCDDAAVRVNRKNLGAGGSTTDFFFTVTASDNKTKAIYTVHVTRLKKGSATAQQTTPSGSSPAPSEPETDPTETESNVQTNTGTAPSVSETASETVIHVSTQKDQPADDPFRTAALVLVSAAAGMILVLGAQHVLQKKDGSKD